MKLLVTGGAGFVGSNLAERLLAEGNEITVIDNLIGGSRGNLAGCFVNDRFRFVKEDLLCVDILTDVMSGHDAVFHLAANSNIPEGRRQTDIDLQLGVMATYNVLEAMRRTGVRKVAFSSSSVVYGEPTVLPVPENYGPLLPISLYGASKLAGEGLISAFCHNYNFQAWIFRFANICGRHGTHGVIVDFIRKLQGDSRKLRILGDGLQAKPYLHVGQCIDGILYIWRNAKDQLNYFNLGCDGATSARRVAEILFETMDLRGVEFEFSGGQRGWPGDVPQMRLDCAKLNRLGWKATLTSDQAVKLATTELVEELSCKL